MCDVREAWRHRSAPLRRGRAAHATITGSPHHYYRQPTPLLQAAHTTITQVCPSPSARPSFSRQRHRRARTASRCRLSHASMQPRGRRAPVPALPRHRRRHVERTGRDLLVLTASARAFEVCAAHAPTRVNTPAGLTVVFKAAPQEGAHRVKVLTEPCKHAAARPLGPCAGSTTIADSMSSARAETCRPHACPYPRPPLKNMQSQLAALSGSSPSVGMGTGMCADMCTHMRMDMCVAT